MRYFTLDALRGFALINMVAYHFCYDLRYLYGLPLRFMDERSGFCWQQMICWTFILVSGASAALSRRQMGRTRIGQELRRKGVAPELIQQALEALDEEEAEDAALVLARKLLKRYEREPDPRKAMQKLLMAMARRGYGFEEARAAAERALQEPEE